MEMVHYKNTYCISNDVTWIESTIFKQAWRRFQQYLYLFISCTIGRQCPDIIKNIYTV